MAAVFSDSLEYALNDFYGIDLTTEILEQCGFEKDNDGIYMIPFNECGLYWLQDKMQLAIGYAPIINFGCKTLHNLQNIYYCLTGKELEVKIPQL